MAKKTENTLDLADVKDFTRSLSKMAKTATSQFSKQLKTDLKKSITSHLNEIAKDLEKNDALANSFMKVGKSATKQFSKVMATELKKSIVDTFNDTSKLLLKSEFLKNNLILLQKTTLKNFSVEFKKGLKKNVIDVFDDTIATLAKSQSLKTSLTTLQKTTLKNFSTEFGKAVKKDVVDVFDKTVSTISTSESLKNNLKGKLNQLKPAVPDNFKVTIIKQVEEAGKELGADTSISAGLDTMAMKATTNFSNKFENNINSAISDALGSLKKAEVGKQYSIELDTSKMSTTVYESIKSDVRGFVGDRTIPVTPNVLVLDANTSYIERVPEKVYESIRDAIKSYVEKRTIAVTPNVNVLDASGANTVQMSDIAKDLANYKEDEALATQKIAKALADVVKHTKEKIPFEKEELKIKVDEAETVKGVADNVAKIENETKKNIKVLNEYHSRWKDIVAEIKKAFAPEVFAPFKSVLSFIADTWKAIWNTPYLLPLTLLTSAFTFLVELVTKLETTVTEVSKAIGMSASYSSKFAYNAVALEKSYRSMGITTQDAVDAAKGLVDTFINLDYLTIKNQTNVTLLSKGLALSGDEVAKSLDTFMVMQATSFDTAGSTLAIAGNMAKVAKIPMRAVMRDLSQNTEKAAKYGGQFAQSAVMASIMAKKIGLSFSDIAKVADGVLDIENSVNSQFEASVLLGREINLERARYYSLIGDTKGVMNEVLKQVGSEAEFNKMNTIQREALAKAFGLDVAALARMISRKKEAQSIDEQMLDVQKKQTQTISQFASKLEPMVGKVEQLMGALVELGYAFLDGLGFGVKEIGDLSSDVLPKVIAWLKDMKPYVHDIGVKIREWYDSASKFVTYLAIGAASIITIIGLVKAFKGAMAAKDAVQTMFGGAGKIKDAAESMQDAANATNALKTAMAGAMKLFGQAAIILAFGAALYMVAKSVEILGNMDFKSMIAGLVGIGAIMVGLSFAVKALGKTGPEGALGAAILLGIGASVLMVSGAIWVAVDAFDRFVGTIKGAIEFLAKLDTTALDNIRKSVLSLTTTMIMAATEIASAGVMMVAAGVSLGVFSLGVIAFSAALTAASVAMAAFSGGAYVLTKAVVAIKEAIVGKSKEELATSVTESINKLLTLSPEDIGKIGLALENLAPQVAKFVNIFSASVGGGLEDKAELLESMIAPLSSFVGAYNNFVANLKTEIKKDVFDANLNMLGDFVKKVISMSDELQKLSSQKTSWLWGAFESTKEDMSSGIMSGIASLTTAMNSLRDVKVEDIKEKLNKFIDYIKTSFANTKLLEQAFYVSPAAEYNIKTFKASFDFSSLASASTMTNINKISEAVKAIGSSTSGFKTVTADISSVTNSIKSLNEQLMQTTNFSSKEITVKIDSSTKEYQSESLKYLKIIAVSTAAMAQKKSASQLSKVDFDQLVNESVL